MSKSISDILGRTGIVNLPQNNRDDISYKWKSTPKDGNFVEEVITSNNPDDPYLTNPDNYTEALKSNLKIIGDTLAKYKQWKDDPTAYVSLFGGLVRGDLGKAGNVISKIDKITENFGLDLIDSGENGVVPLPAYLEYEDKRLLTSSIDAVKKLLGSALGGKPSTNYELIRMLTTNSGVLNDIINIATGDFLKKEFEKNRLPWQLPDSVKDDGFPVQFYEGQDVDLKGDSIGDRIVDSIKNYANKLINKGDVGIDAKDIIHNLNIVSKNGGRRADYFTIGDPYASLDIGSEYKGEYNIASVTKYLRDEGFLSGYKDFAGFELGSNHMWRIQLHPYNSEAHGSKSCVPPLPYYQLPNLWAVTKEVESVIPQYGNNENSKFNMNTWINNAKDRIFDTIVERLTAKTDLGIEDQDLKSAIVSKIWGKKDKSRQLDNNVRYFSFEYDTPVISYDLSLGIFKYDNIGLFNGSGMSYISGFTSFPTMTLSILDDSYGSMFKYMNTYINSIYDVESSSLAPYYNMAFEIDLLILRTGGTINHRFKFIGIPTDYNVRLDGSSEPNDNKLDIVFSIIGLKRPDEGKAAFTNDDRNPKLTELSGRDSIKSQTQMTWDDIMVKLS